MKHNFYIRESYASPAITKHSIECTLQVPILFLTTSTIYARQTSFHKIKRVYGVGYGFLLRYLFNNESIRERFFI